MRKEKSEQKEVIVDEIMPKEWEKKAVERESELVRKL